MVGFGMELSVREKALNVIGVTATADGEPTIVFREKGQKAQDFPTQLAALSESLETRLRTLEIDFTVIVETDYIARQKSTVVHQRGQVEGVLLATARRNGCACELLTLTQIANLLGHDSAKDAEAAGRELIKGAGAAAVASLAAVHRAGA
jgi:Holliday junction resolvasome RuvABC endonuclease subunit